MTVGGGMLRLQTPGNGHIVDLTEGVARIVATAGVDRGAGDGLRRRLDRGGDDDGVRAGWGLGPAALLDRLIPAQGDYEHNRLNHDSNSHAHLRAALIGPSETIPVVDGRLALGIWQQIVLLDFDDRARERTISVQVLS